LSFHIRDFFFGGNITIDREYCWETEDDEEIDEDD
jgi:hypothetical protein